MGKNDRKKGGGQLNFLSFKHLLKSEGGGEWKYGMMGRGGTRVQGREGKSEMGNGNENECAAEQVVFRPHGYGEIVPANFRTTQIEVPSSWIWGDPEKFADASGDTNSVLTDTGRWGLMGHVACPEEFLSVS